MKKAVLCIAAGCSAALLAALAFDLAYTLGYQGAWKPDFWLDRAHIPRQYSASDPELGFVRKANVHWRGQVPGTAGVVDYRTDADGFRNPPGIGRADVAFIGDSYTEAAGVPEEETFARRSGQLAGLPVVNLGRGAYGPQQELGVLKRYAPRYHPRAVVWQLFAGNDLGDSAEFGRWQRDPHGRDLPVWWRYWNGSLLRRVTRTIRGGQAGGVARATLRNSGGGIEMLNLRYVPEAVDKFGSGWRELTRSLEEGREWCGERGIRMAVMVIPTMYAALAPHLRHIDGRKPGGSELEDAFGPFWRAAGGDYIDLLPLLADAARTDNRRLYFPNDEHLDARGHDVVARAVADWLRRAGVVPESVNTAAAGRIPAR